MAKQNQANTQIAPVKTGKGRNVDPSDDIDGGPLRKRGCTDIFFLLLFIAFLGGMGYTAYRAWDRGHPFKLIHGHDSWGNVCNLQNTAIPGATYSGRDTTGLTKTFYFNPTEQITGSGTVICVNQCPDSDLLTVSDLQNYATINNTRLCRYDIAPASYTNGSIFGSCPSLPVFSQFDILNRCVPRILVSVAQQTLTGLASILNAPLSLLQSTCDSSADFFQKFSSNVTNSWKEILYLIAISIGVAFVITLLMRFIAAIIVWTLVIGIALGSLAATGYCWYQYYFWSTNTTDQSESAATTTRNWLIAASVVTGVTVIILLLLLIMRKRIGLVVQLFREAGKSIAKMPFLLLQPLWTFIVLALFLGGLVYVFLYVETAANPVVNNSTKQVTFQTDQVTFYLKWYYILGILWVAQFVFACHYLVIAGAVATWFFTRDKSKLGWPILSSTKRLIIYHLGSVAFGSLIIALIQFARLILGYIQSKLQGRAGPVVSFLLKCLACCLWCFEKVMKFINKNAYIMIAIYGCNFCRGAKKAFTLIVSNILRVGAINSVGAFVLFLGKAGIVAIVVVIGLELLRYKQLCYIWAPLLIAGLGAYIVAHCFLGVYGLAIDTIFVCFCEDCDRNDGIEKPYYMSTGLMEYTENASKAIEADKMRRKKKTRVVALSENTNESNSKKPDNHKANVNW